MIHISIIIYCSNQVFVDSLKLYFVEFIDINEKNFLYGIRQLKKFVFICSYLNQLRIDG